MIESIPISRHDLSFRIENDCGKVSLHIMCRKNDGTSLDFYVPLGRPRTTEILDDSSIELLLLEESPLSGVDNEVDG